MSRRQKMVYSTRKKKTKKNSTKFPLNGDPHNSERERWTKKRHILDEIQPKSQKKQKKSGVASIEKKKKQKPVKNYQNPSVNIVL